MVSATVVALAKIIVLLEIYKFSRLFRGLFYSTLSALSLILKMGKICGCSQDTALRDNNDLISKGMLCDSGEGGRSANYILPDIAPVITLGKSV